MLNKVFERKFVKDLEKAKKRKLDFEKLNKVLDILVNKKQLPPQYKNHKLHGEYTGHLECHIEPDWLLIYYSTKTELILVRTGTHSDLF